MTAPARELTHLQALEPESVHVLREVAADSERPVLLFSGGKDSVVVLRTAEKIVPPQVGRRVPFHWDDVVAVLRRSPRIRARGRPLPGPRQPRADAGEASRCPPAGPRLLRLVRPCASR